MWGNRVGGFKPLDEASQKVAFRA